MKANFLIFIIHPSLYLNLVKSFRRFFLKPKYSMLHITAVRKLLKENGEHYVKSIFFKDLNKLVEKSIIKYCKLKVLKSTPWVIEFK